MNFDPSEMKKSIYDFPEHMQEAISIGQSINLHGNYDQIKNVVVAGMGGSAIGGDVVRALMSDKMKVPFFVSRHYQLPSWVNESTLVICSSYSGNTEETLSAFENAVNRSATILGITTGGKLEKLLNEQNLDCVKIPGGLQPRAALAFSFVPMLFVAQKIGLVDQDPTENLHLTIDLLKKVRDQYQSETDDNPTFALANRIAQTIPVIYGETESTEVVAVRWKGQLAENSKMLSYCNFLPELNHNEIVGWENNPELMKHLSLIWLVDDSGHKRVKYRHQISQKIINSNPAMQHTVKVNGPDHFSRFLHLIHFGDWVSYWCAKVHGTDPTPVHKIDQLKRELSQVL